MTLLPGRERIHQTPQCGAFMATFKEDVHFDHMHTFSREGDGA